MESILKAANLKKYYGKGDTMVKALDGVDTVTKNGILYPYNPTGLYKDAF